MATAFNATPEADLVGEFKGTRFAVKHVQYSNMLTTHNLVLLVQRGDGSWVIGSVIIEDIKEADVVSVGAVAFIVAALALVNSVLKRVFGDPGQEGGPPPEPADVWAAMDQALHDGFEYRVTATGVEMKRKAS